MDARLAEGAWRALTGSTTRGTARSRRTLSRRRGDQWALRPAPPVTLQTKLLYTAVSTAILQWRNAHPRDPALLWPLAQAYVAAMRTLASGPFSPFTTLDDYWDMRLTVRRVRPRATFAEATTAYDHVVLGHSDRPQPGPGQGSRPAPP